MAQFLESLGPQHVAQGVGSLAPVDENVRDIHAQGA